jgi:hypothetical protein
MRTRLRQSNDDSPDSAGHCDHIAINVARLLEGRFLLKFEARIAFRFRADGITADWIEGGPASPGHCRKPPGVSSSFVAGMIWRCRSKRAGMSNDEGADSS